MLYGGSEEYDVEARSMMLEREEYDVEARNMMLERGI